MTMSPLRRAAALALVLAAAALPAFAERLVISVETAYLYQEPHAVDGHPDGGSVRITNRGHHAVTLTSVFLSGWTSGATLEWAATGPATLQPGQSGVYNQAGPPYTGDTSNLGPLADPGSGVRIDVEGLVRKKRFHRTYFDNVRYALTDGVNTGIDEDFLGLGDTSMPYGPVRRVDKQNDDPEDETDPDLAALLYFPWLATGSKVVLLRDLCASH